MTKTIALLLVSLTVSITGCSSTERQYVDYQHQYCYTDETITVKDGTNVSNATKVQCTDRPRIEHVVKDAGFASDCRISRPLNVSSRDPKYGETLLCKFSDPLGKTVWRPVNETLAYPSFN